MGAARADARTANMCLPNLSLLLCPNSGRPPKLILLLEGNYFNIALFEKMYGGICL
jgi:hypothetical protein